MNTYVMAGVSIDIRPAIVGAGGELWRDRRGLLVYGLSWIYAPSSFGDFSCELVVYNYPSIDEIRFRMSG